jgi:hypothetical protein
MLRRPKSSSRRFLGEGTIFELSYDLKKGNGFVREYCSAPNIRIRATSHPTELPPARINLKKSSY